MDSYNISFTMFPIWLKNDEAMERSMDQENGIHGDTYTHIHARSTEPKTTQMGVRGF